MGRDEVFQNPIAQASDFKFDTKVVRVFDDMVVRSVPFYLEIQRMIAELAGQYALENTVIYDLGCSTGTTMVNMNATVPRAIKFIGVDDSDQMLQQCRENLTSAGFDRKFDLVHADLNKGFEVTNASVIVLCLTLQFIRPMHRLRVLQHILHGLVAGGCLILVEKVLGEESSLNRNFIKYYYDFKKRNHYSDLEISQKREALENVLVPYKLTEDQELLASAGFSHSEVFFKWYNFSGIIALK